MRIVKPSWVNYRGEPIISIHFHPDGSIFATGGVLNDSGQVSVWSANSFTSESFSQTLEPQLPRLLSQMTNHHGCVNCVRWNHAGNWLASAGVDKCVIIWQQKNGSTQNKVNLHSGGQYIESWTSVFILRGHSGTPIYLYFNDRFLCVCVDIQTKPLDNWTFFPRVCVCLHSHFTYLIFKMYFNYLRILLRWLTVRGLMGTE